MSDALKPITLNINRPYLTIHLIEWQKGLEELVANSGDLFSEPFDELWWQIATEEGAYSGEVPPSQLWEVIARCNHQTIQVRLKLYRVKRTQIAGIKLPPVENYVYIGIDFPQKWFISDVSIKGVKLARQVEPYITRGVELINVELPPAHKYLESYLSKFLKDNPDTGKNIFLIMRFKDEPPFRRLVETIRESCSIRGLTVLRADDKDYTDDLWDNVLTYMYGCDSAIAVFDQINARDFNPNVALEAGFFYARCKPVLLLKDIAIPAMPSDVAGRIYKGFNTYDPEGTLAPQVEKWLHDYAIGEEANHG